MISLYNYVNTQPKHLVIDCHVHLFNDEVLNYPYKSVDGKIVMVENSIKHADVQLLPYFDNYIKNGLNPSDRLLCVGCDRWDTYNIYKKYRQYISGFGEIKCYKHCVDSEGNELEHYDTNILNSIFEMGIDLPIFIHWDLNGKHDDEFEQILHDYPTAKLILCHCGINQLDDQKQAFNKAMDLQTKYPNLWTSISWVALDYLTQHKEQLSFISIPDHTIVGTDFNPEMSNAGVDEKSRYSAFKDIYDRFDVPVAVKNLFI